MITSMKKVALVVSVLSAVSVVSAAAKEKTPEEHAAIRERLQLKVGGGFIDRPETGKGFIALVDKTGGAYAKALADVHNTIYLEYRLRVTNYVQSVTAGAKPSATVVLADGKAGEPMLLVDPDARLATISVAALKADNPAPETLELRVKKSLLRGFGFAIGGYVSAHPSSVLHPMPDLATLDKASEKFPMALEFPLQENQQMGLSMMVLCTYRDALKEGWAPKPTNEHQERLWKRFKEKPTAPIKIKFDPKKGE